MQGIEQLVSTLRRIDGRGYKAYKDIRGMYAYDRYVLSIDHVQGDPFASPSRLRIIMKLAEAAFPPSLHGNTVRKTALEDYINRRFAEAIRMVVHGRRGSGKSGMIGVETPRQTVLRRSAVVILPEEGRMEVRFTAGLPAAGRRVLAHEAIDMFTREIPSIAKRSLFYSALDAEDVQKHVDAVEHQHELRKALARHNLVAFIADGSILPRRSGIDDRPMEAAKAVPFRSPESLRVTIECPPYPPVSGMGIPEGVTVIVGGGYHGKSTLLSALERGIYNHVPGDGRELVVSHPATAKIRAEDGRSVQCFDISTFINNLPSGTDTTAFSTENASGSTSQAANIMEALEAGARVLLLDEDTSATNFMIRDERMRKLVPGEKEPITPLIDRVRELYSQLGVSTVIVTGGSGDYLEVADRVIMMDAYIPHDVTEEARRIVESYGNRLATTPPTPVRVPRRIPLPGSLDPSRGRRDYSVKARDLQTVEFGTQSIDLSSQTQLDEPAQTRMIGEIMVYCLKYGLIDGRRTIAEILDEIDARMRKEGPDGFSDIPVGNLAEVRRLEVAAAINRLRTLRCRKEGGTP